MTNNNILVKGRKQNSALNGSSQTVGRKHFLRKYLSASKIIDTCCGMIM